MPMLLIEGKYRILNASPDGDSIRFYPNDPAEWDLVEHLSFATAQKKRSHR